MNNDKSVTRSDSPVPVATLSYDEIAARMQQALDTIASLVPRAPMTLGTTRPYIRQRLGVSPPVIAAAATAAEEESSLRGLMDLADTRDMLAMEWALRPVFDRMNMVGEDMRLVLDARRAKSGAQAMNVYAAAKRVAAGQGGASVATHVDQIKALMPKGKGPRRKKATTPPPVTEPPADEKP